MPRTMTLWRPAASWARRWPDKNTAEGRRRPSPAFSLFPHGRHCKAQSEPREAGREIMLEEYLLRRGPGAAGTRARSHRAPAQAARERTWDKVRAGTALRRLLTGTPGRHALAGDFAAWAAVPDYSGWGRYVVLHGVPGRSLRLITAMVMAKWVVPAVFRA